MRRYRKFLKISKENRSQTSKQEKRNSHHACEKRSWKHRSNEERYCQIAKFYEDLQSCKNDETTKQDLKTLVTMLTMMKNIEDDAHDRHIPELTMKELSIANDSLKKRKSADSKGIKAEDFNDKNDTGDLQLDHQAKLHDL